MTIAINLGEDQHRRAVVLVVDDDQALRETTVEILREEGHIVVQAADGMRALDLLRGSEIDVLLLDLGLPYLDGPAVLEALEEPPTVVVVSGFESVEEDDLREHFGAVLFDCLHKPVSPLHLIAVTSAAARHATSNRPYIDSS
jgi:two-component system, OmpR family, response regulator ResD